MEEIEAKYLDIDAEALAERILALGGKRVGDFFYRRIVFDYPDFRLNVAAAWLRLRDEGDRVTLGFKQRLGTTSHDGSSSDAGMKEIEIVVSDFEKTAQLLFALGMIVKFEQHNRRSRYVLDGVELDIDTWPRLKPYLEIEGSSWEQIDAMAVRLGLDPKKRLVTSTHQIYKLNGINELEYVKMTFDEFVRRA